MLRYLSSYLFQNESQPNENDPTTTVSSSEPQPGPSSTDKHHDNRDEDGGRKEEFMDLEMREEGDEGEEDWVLIGEKKEEEVETPRNLEVEIKEDTRVQVQPVNLIAAESTEEEEEEDDEVEEEVQQGLIWENKLIEHPSMSVYVDLATSVNSEGVTASCISLGSIAPATSPGESVIVLEQSDSDLEEDSSEDEDDSMDFLEAVASEALPTLHTAEPVVLDMDDGDDDDSEENPSDRENHAIPLVTTKAPFKPVVPAPVQNGRRKKGHYPCPSSNSSQMPRRAHLRNASNSASSSFINLTNGAADVSHDAIKRVKRSTASVPTGVNNSACGIAVVNGAPGSPTTAPMVAKNLKLGDMFPTAKRQPRRASPPQKSGATSRGHFLQEGHRRQDMQNYTKHSHVNNDRRSAAQRRAPKTPSGGAK